MTPVTPMLMFGTLSSTANARMAPTTMRNTPVPTVHAPSGRDARSPCVYPAWRRVMPDDNPARVRCPSALAAIVGPGHERMVRRDTSGGAAGLEKQRACPAGTGTAIQATSVAPPVGLEPTTLRLTAECSAN